MKKVSKLITTGLITITLLSATANLNTAIVNAESITATNRSAKKDSENDNSQQTFIIPDYANLDLPNTDSSTYNSTGEPDFDNMSVQELNQYIDKKILEEKNFNSLYGESKVEIPGVSDALRQMWKAAGTIAKKSGYPCAGTLIRYSASKKNYTEWSQGGGLFASRIRRTSAYKRAKKRNAKSIEFTKADSKDLFYALHLVSSNFHYTKKHPVHIHDKFDFQLMTSYNSPFTSIINNWAYLCSHINVLYPSKVDIYF